MARLTNVSCYYTGGNIYIYEAKFNDEVWIGTDFELTGSYDIPWHEIDDGDQDYEAHEKMASIPYPTWAEVLQSIRENCAEYVVSDVEDILEYYCSYGQKMTDRILGENDNEPVPEDSTEQLDTIKTYAIGNGEITLTEHDAEELRIMLQTEYLAKTIRELIDENKYALYFKSPSTLRHFVDDLVRLCDDWVNYDSSYFSEMLEENIFNEASKRKIVR